MPGHDEWQAPRSSPRVPRIVKTKALALPPSRPDVPGHEAVPDLLRRRHPCAVRASRLRAGHPARQLAISSAAATTAASAEDRGAGDPQNGRTAQALLRADRAAKVVWRARQ